MTRVDRNIVARIRRKLKARPFSPFSIVIRKDSNAATYEIPSAKHISFNPPATILVVWVNNGDGISFPVGWVKEIRPGPLVYHHVPRERLLLHDPR